MGKPCHANIAGPHEPILSLLLHRDLYRRLTRIGLNRARPPMANKITKNTQGFSNSSAFDVYQAFTVGFPSDIGMIVLYANHQLFSAPQLVGRSRELKEGKYRLPIY